ncbi:MAG: HIT family protein [Bacteroidetes bacterium]|nr:HIT family protein [Bacteroidota bacterium]HET6243488.1 HIT family protein [Bacteroidia bacterium]
MASVFTKIINGEIPSHKIAETDDFFAFLDISPLALGHTLVIPKKEVDYILNLEDELYSHLWAFAKTIAIALEKSVDCKRIGIAVIGLEVAHTHIHLIPINKVDDINFSRPKMKLSDEQYALIAKDIRNNLAFPFN